MTTFFVLDSRILHSENGQFTYCGAQGGSGPLHPIEDAPILQVLLDAFPAPVGLTHKLWWTDSLLGIATVQY